MSDVTTQQPTHETEDASVRSVFSLLALLIVILLLIIAFGVLMHRVFLGYFERQNTTTRISPVAQLHRLPPEPRLQTNPGIDMIHFREIENTVLETYAWTDSAAGKVRIPITRAMELIAERGLPSRSQGKGSNQ